MDASAVGAFAESVPVDLALDLGTGRTCVLIDERHPAGKTSERDLRGVVALPLRDLSRPWLTTRGPFPSRMEFARASFGNEALSRWSGRMQAFHWPSLARIGNEAAELAAAQCANEAVTGLSSPMHYVWDEAPSPHVWRFAGRGAEGGAAQPDRVGDHPRSTFRDRRRAGGR